MIEIGTLRKETVFWLSCLFVLSAAIIWVRTQTVKATYLYVQQDKTLRKLQQDVQAERVRWLKQTAPGRLEAIAVDLGLAAPALDQVVRMKTAKASLSEKK